MVMRNPNYANETDRDIDILFGLVDDGVISLRLAQYATDLMELENCVGATGFIESSLHRSMIRRQVESIEITIAPGRYEAREDYRTLVKYVRDRARELMPE